MRILVHDYAGYAFPLQLSRALARRHHQVLHLYSGSFQAPKGLVKKMDADSGNFDCVPCILKTPSPNIPSLRDGSRRSSAEIF